MPYRSRELQTPSHSLELERRITTVEADAERLREVHDDLREDHERISQQHSDKLSLHEKAILAIASILYIMAQDKFPALAAIIKGFRP